MLQAMRSHCATVILEVLWGVPRYPGMWLRLHELQTYTDARIRPQLGAGSDRQLAGALGAIAQTYREALILGCALVYPPPQLLTSALVESLSDWASGTRLLSALRQDWQRGWWVVDTLDDVPPWYLDGVLRDDWHGYRLELPGACREFLSLASPSR